MSKNGGGGVSWCEYINANILPSINHLFLANYEIAIKDIIAS